jgi:acyl carrier protein
MVTTIIMNDSDASRIQTVIREFLRERFDIPAEKIQDNTSIRNLGLDSMMMLEVMMELEDRLGVKLRDLSMPANPTLRDVVDLVARNEPS